MNKPTASKKDCASVRRKLSAFADGEVSLDWFLAIEAHLKECPDCRLALVELRQLWQDLDDSISVQPRPEFAREVMRKITEQSPSSHLDWRNALANMFPAPAAIAAMVLFGLMMGGWMGRGLWQEGIGPLATVATSQEQAVTLDALDVFAPTPRGSLAQGYFVLLSEVTQVKQ